MRTEETLLTQIVSGEIRCPCDDDCIAKPPLISLTRPSCIETKHEMFEQYILCITRFTKNFIKDRVIELRSRAEKNLRIPLETWRLFDESARDQWFVDAVKETKLHFSDTRTELEKMITQNLFTICEMAIWQAQLNVR